MYDNDDGKVSLGRYAYKMHGSIYVRPGAIARDVLIGLAVFIVLWMTVMPQYRVWSREKEGEAALAQASQDRKVAVLEAQAKKDSAQLLADTEIIRAGGVAQANKIIGDSLKNNEAYLRYLWIDTLDKTKNQVIYVPTEANLPLLESQRLNPAVKP